MVSGSHVVQVSSPWLPFSRRAGQNQVTVESCWGKIRVFERVPTARVVKSQQCATVAQGVWQLSSALRMSRIAFVLVASIVKSPATALPTQTPSV